MSAAGPLYDLKAAQDLAKAGKVTFSRENAQLKFQELGYSTTHALECITRITPDEYHNSPTYGVGKSYDAYLTHHRGPDGIVRVLYVKFRIPPGTTILQLSVVSFHTPEF